MAYGQQNTQSRSNGNNQGFVKKPAAQETASPAPASSGRPDADGMKVKLSLFKVFKNKGLGYSTVLKEDVLIKAGTKVAVFEDVLKGKDGTEYQVLNIKKMIPKDVG